MNGVTTTLPGVAVNPIPLSVGHIEENLKTPFTRQETIGAQFDLGRGLSASADLKFIQGRDQYISSERQPDDRRPDHRSGVPIAEQAGQWRRAGRQAAVGGGRLPVDAGSRLQVAYALGSATNNSINNLGNGIGGTPATNPFDYSVDQGPASNDQRHILNVSGNVALPWGISIAPLFRATSGIRSESGDQRTSVPSAGLSGVLQPMLPIQHHGPAR